MFRTSKRVNGVNLNGRGVVLHSSPTPRITVPPIQSYRTPILGKRVEEVGEPVNREGGGTQLKEKVFSLTGVNSSEPSVLLSSNFIPIWEGENLNPAGESVYLREVSRSVNSKVSLLILSGTSGSLEYVRGNREGVKGYIDREEGSGFSTTLLDLTDSTSTSLDIGSGEFPRILLDGGYTRESVRGYSPSKIYSQTLVEVKRNTSTYSSHLTSQGGTPRNGVREDSDPFLLSDLDTSPGRVKFWFNPTYSVPTFENLIEEGKVEENISLLTQFSSLSFLEVGGTNPKPLPTSTLDEHRESGREIPLLGTLLFKEGYFSNTLKGGEVGETLSRVWGYTLNQKGGNFQLWDFTFGRFPTSVLDPVTNPTGKGNSLSSFASEVVPIPGGNEYYHVLTWENSPLSGSSSTPGVEYYVDSLSTLPDGSGFETSRLSSLVNKSYRGGETIRLISGILGWNPDGSRREFSPLTFPTLVTRFSSVPLFYSSRITLTPTGLGGLNGSTLRNLTGGEKNGIRIPSLICKLCTTPTDGYRGVSERIKFLLFTWVMNYVRLKESTFEVQVKCWETIPSLGKKISNEICGVFTSLTEELFPHRVEEGRVFTVTSTNYPLETSSRSVKSTRNYKNFVEGFYESAFGLVEGSLWKIIVDTLYELGNNFNVYSGGVTGYSNLTRETYLYHSFELILRIISSGVPENLLGTFSTGGTSGILTDSPTPESLGEYFDPARTTVNLVGGTYPGEEVSNRLRESLEVYRGEEEREWGELKTLGDTLGEIYRNSNSLLTFLRGTTSTDWLGVVKPLYDRDTSLTPTVKGILFNLSLAREQFTSQLWRESEITDRVWDERWYGVLKSHPLYGDLPPGCGDLLPVNPLKLISFPSLSPYFRGIRFGKVKGNNLRVLSVGIPHRLNRTLRSSPSAKDPLSNVVRIRVFKLDRIHPDIVYNPKEFLFEMNRFPTRSLPLWRSESILGGGSDPLTLPTKVVNYRGEVVNCRDYSAGFLYDLYGNSLTDGERREIYSNHTLSFLLEEYLRWFSGVELSEMGWGNFTQLTSGSPILDEGWGNFTGNAKGGGRFTVEGGNVVDSTGSLIEPNSSLRMYLRNETLFLNPDTLSRVHVYPRKFDRVFTLVVDPDEFTVDTAHSTESTLTTLTQLGVLVKDEKSGVYTHRDTSENDISMCEYFTTVEPYGFGKEGV